ncbi:MAG: EVE domain-containing protein [Gammaproteobacteria bacterium]|nr:MAG: EVE domain-containing protein [Gammaproteobacteria bacterium]
MQRMNYWLLKSEPAAFSVDDLAALSKQTDHWDGVRNYQARNFMRDQMRQGDHAFFYHSNCKQHGVVAIVQIVRAAYPDPSAFDPGSPYYDPKSDAADPRWFMVDVQLVRRLQRLIGLAEIKRNPALRDMALVQRGNRLSVMPLTAKQWNAVLRMEVH